MTDLATISLETLDKMFREETKAARAKADKAGLPPAGTDDDGQVVKPKEDDNQTTANSQVA
jgi:hypothetical protein